MTADENDKNLAPRELRWKWYSHPLPLTVLLCFEIILGFCIWDDVRRVPAVPYDIGICTVLMILHPVALLLYWGLWSLGSDAWWIDEAIAVPVLLVIFGGFQWYALTWAGIGIYRRGQRSQRSLGHCPACLYDLHGNTSGICPECGTPIVEGIGHEIMEELSDGHGKSPAQIDANTSAQDGTYEV